MSLLRQWHRARTPTVIHNPSLGAIHHMHVNLPAAASTAPVPSLLRGTPRTDADAPSLTTTTMLSASLDLGAAVHSAPFTGKLSKRPLLASPIDHLGRPLLGLPILAATSLALSHDGTRLVWGMRDGSLRFASAAASGRGTPGGTLDAGEVRALEAGTGGAHREGASVHCVAFSNAGGTRGGRVLRGGRRQRAEVFATAAADGVVAVWSLAVPPAAGARERPAPAVKLWQGRWDVALDVPPPGAAQATAVAAARQRVKPTSLALDAGWLGRHHGRPASIAVGRSDGKTVVWPAVSLEEASLASGASLAADYCVLDAAAGATGPVDTLELDPPAEGSSALALLVHQAGACTFSRHVFGDGAPKSTTFGHSAAAQLAPLTAFAVDFDDAPAPAGVSVPATPAEGKITFARPAGARTGVSSFFPPALSRSTSELSVSISRPESPFAPAPDADVGPRSFGRRKYVVAGDAEGRVYLWDWESRQSDEEQERGDVVAPAKAVQGLEIEQAGGQQASKVTALELTDVGVFVGGCVSLATLRDRVLADAATRASSGPQTGWRPPLLFDPRPVDDRLSAHPVLPGSLRPAAPLSPARAGPRRGRRGGALAREPCPRQPRRRRRRHRREGASVAGQQRGQEEGGQGAGRQADGAAGAVQRCAALFDLRVQER